MPKTNVYKAAGFTLLNKLDESGLAKKGVAAGINIAKGDALHIDSDGYATNAVTAFAAEFIGIASHAANNTGALDGAINVLVVPPLEKYQFIVPVEEDAVILQTDVGEIYDLESCNTIDLSDMDGAANAKGFYVDEIDASTAAVAVNTKGYAIGHFVAHTA